MIVHTLWSLREQSDLRLQSLLLLRNQRECLLTNREFTKGLCDRQSRVQSRITEEAPQTGVQTNSRGQL